LVNFFYEDDFNLSLNKKEVRFWIKNVVKKENKKLSYLNFVFCTDSYLLELNQKYLKHNSLTDVIAFDFSESKKTIEGDVYISVDRVKENAKKYSPSFKKELLRVLLHGVLHLIGYKDKTKEQKKIMASKENVFVSVFNSKKFHVEHKR